MVSSDVKMDEIDRQIITLLSSNARMTVTEIATRVRRSRSSVYERMARLERSGQIGGYTTVRGGAPSLRAYMLLRLAGPVCARVAPEIELIPEVLRSQSVSGDIDMILYVETESMESLADVRERIEAVEGVNSVTTMPILVDRFDRS